MLTRDDVVKIIYDQNGPIQRFTQDSPVLPDVWIAFAERPREPHDVLLTPYQSALAFSGGAGRSGDRPLTPGSPAQMLKKRLEAERATTRWKRWGRDEVQRKPDIAYNQSTVAVRLWFDELVRVVLPLSHWWATRICKMVPDSGSARSGSVRSGSRARKGSAKGQSAEGLSSVLAQLQKEENRHALAESLALPASTPKYVPADVLWSIHVIGTIARAHETVTAHKADTRTKDTGKTTNAPDLQRQVREPGGRDTADALRGA